MKKNKTIVDIKINTSTDIFFDTHCHLTLCEENIPIRDHLAKCKESNIIQILDPGTHLGDFHIRKKKLSPFSNVHLGLAIAPHTVECLPIDDLIEMDSLLKKEKIIAISEIGLDYFHNKENKSVQQKLLEAQLELAKSHNKPVFFHIRNAFEDAYSIIKNAGISTGAIHCFTGTKKEAKRFIDLGLYISFSGILTFKSAKNIQEAANYAPFDRILTETDAPYLAPEPHRGKKNTSVNIIYINKKIAELKDVNFSQMNTVLYQNATKLLHL